MKFTIAPQRQSVAPSVFAVFGLEEVPHSFGVDWKRRILRCRIYGRVTDQDLKASYIGAYQHAFHLQSRAGVVDSSGITAFEVSAKVIRELATSAPALPGLNLYLITIAPSPKIYRMARMYEKWGKATRPNFHVVRTEQEAWAMLAIENPRFEPLEPW